jgi:hypothetical protein
VGSPSIWAGKSPTNYVFLVVAVLSYFASPQPVSVLLFFLLAGFFWGASYYAEANSPLPDADRRVPRLAAVTMVVMVLAVLAGGSCPRIREVSAPLRRHLFRRRGSYEPCRQDATSE